MTVDRERTLTIGAVVVALSLGAFFRVSTGLVTLAGVAALTVGIAAATRLRFVPVACAVVWFHSLAHLLKRAIFLAGPQPRFAYYAVIAIPSILLVIAAALAITRKEFSLPSLATRGLLAYGGLYVVSTMVGSGSEVPLATRLSALQERAVPMLGFLVGLALPVGSRAFDRVARAAVWSVFATVPYGIYKFFVGPGPLERHWAEATAVFSTEGHKLADYLQGLPGSEFRSFSYYADPHTWGNLLLFGIGLTMAVASLPGRRLTRPVRTLLVTGFVVALFVSLTRTAWLGLLAASAVYALLWWRPARRPSVLLTGVGLAFVVVLSAGSFLYNSVLPRVSSGGASASVQQRYLRRGTLEARLGAWSQLPGDIIQHPIIGAGYGYLEVTAERARESNPNAFVNPSDHNIAVETVVVAGAPALLALGVFMFAVFRQGLAGARSVAPRPFRWLVALAFGMFVTGYTNGAAFMDALFFMLCGILAARPNAVSSENADHRALVTAA